MNWLRSSLGRKLLTSYMVVIMVGIVTLAVSAESIIPTAFNRHMAGMQMMMGGKWVCKAWPMICLPTFARPLLRRCCGQLVWLP